MKSDVIVDRGPMYIGTIDNDFRERHISLVPYIPGLEAICGQQLRTTRPGPRRAVITSATCPACRARGIEIAGPEWADATAAPVRKR